MGFEGKVVWITGASSGIGEALAYELARQGAHLILSARREDRLAQVRANCHRSDSHRVLAFDVADADALSRATASALAEAGAIDFAVLNAGISQRSLARETSSEVDRRLLEVNFFAPVALAKALLPSMLERRSGHLVVVSSLVGKFGTPLRSAYAASKHALHGFFDSLRAETWRDGIDVTLVCPGFIRTELPVHALLGDGKPQGKMDRAQLEGYPADACARKIVRAIQRRRAEVLIGGKEVLAVYLSRYLPSLFRRLIRKARVT
jgi:short-subunit dehydrogenase